MNRGRLSVAFSGLRRAALGLTAAMALMGGTASAQQAVPDTLTETYSAWTVQCRAGEDKQRQCAMTQMLTREEGGERLLLVELAIGEDKQPSMTILTPFGLQVARGAQLRTDEDEPRNLEFFTCVPTGCILRQTLGEPELAALRRGAVLTANFIIARGGEPFALQVSLEGFSAAYRRLVELAA